MKRILYVEDEPALGKIVKESLISRNYDVHHAEDGLKALDLFREKIPDICVIDIMLPKLDGYTLAQEIRSKSPHLPIIFLTAKSQVEDVVKGFQSGGNDYLKKPFSLEELIARIENLLKLTSGQAPEKDKIVFGNYIFQPSKFELQSPDGSIKRLSYKEAGILLMLCENRNTTVERKDILLKFWGDDSFFNSRNLDVYISKLRDYLKQDKSVQVITIKGIGYYFSC